MQITGGTLYKGVEDMGALFKHIVERQPTKNHGEASDSASVEETTTSHPRAHAHAHSTQHTTSTSPLGTTSTTHTTQHVHSEAMPQQPSVALHSQHKKTNSLDNLD